MDDVAKVLEGCHCSTIGDSQDLMRQQIASGELNQEPGCTGPASSLLVRPPFVSHL
jgi:hypothetical protein